MAQRYSLRFENGERRGEIVPITAERFTVGRQPGNALRIVENSVSGRHAELVIDARGVLLQDLGSTNGTRVGGERVLETRLNPGCVVSFGNVRLSLLDPQSTATPGEDPGRSVSAKDLERARQGSKLGGTLLIVLATVGAGSWWWAERGGGGGGESRRPVVGVAGNLLSAGYSFEGETSPWTARDSAATSFVRGVRARYSGEQGISVQLEAGEDAEHASPSVAVREGSSLSAACELRSIGDAGGRIGIEFLHSDGGPQGAELPAPVVAWSRLGSGIEAFQRLELTAAVPGGYDRARVLIAAEVRGTQGSGRLDVDDVTLVAGSGGGPRATLDAYRFYAVGNGVNLFKVDRTLVSGLALRPADAPTPRESVGLALEVESQGVRLTPQLAGAGLLVLRAEGPALVGGLATMGAAGYALRADDFEDGAVTDLLFGRGVELVRIAFGAPLAVRARYAGAALDFEVDLSGGVAPLVQVRYRAEREAAVNLAADAEAAEQRGALGECMRLWGELLDRYPFEGAKVSRANAVRARLLRAGVDELRGLDAVVERARFFRLLDLYRQCRATATEIAGRYAGSEVEDGALELVAAIDADLTLLEADLDRHEVARLHSILRVLEAQGAEQLAREMRAYLAQRYGEVID